MTDRTRHRTTPNPGPHQLAGTTKLWYPQSRTILSQTSQYVDPPPGIVKYDYIHDESHPGPPYMEGSDMLGISYESPWEKQGNVSIKSIPITSPVAGYYFNNTDRRGEEVYSGGFYPQVPPGFDNLGPSESVIYDPLTAVDFINPDDLSDLGNRGYGKLRPKIEDASIFQTLYEWKDIPRMLRTTSHGFHDIWKAMGGRRGETLSPKGLGDQFLNQQFGWRPLINDIRKTFEVVTNFRTHVERKRKTNGEWIRRRAYEDPIQSAELLYYNNGTSNFCRPSLGYDKILPNGGKQFVFRQRFSRVWYAGAFRSYYPEFDADYEAQYPTVAKVQQMVDLLGLNVNPSNLYAVMPWTWLIDWFADVSDGVQRFQDWATDAVVSKYFYLMRTTYDRFKFLSEFVDVNGTNHSFEWYRSVTVKRRKVGGSPFSFSAQPGGLNPTQLAILGALGVTRT